MPMPSRSFVFFGPPGVGKSTFIKAARRFFFNRDCDVIALDVEELGDSSSERQKAAQKISRLSATCSFVVGGADTQPADYVGNWRRVLVLPEYSIYIKRRKRRDRDNPLKALQPDVYNEFSKGRSQYDEVWHDFPPVPKGD
jgi:GTPase SAR1 family protein